MNKLANSNVHKLQTDPRFDFDAAKRFIGLMRGDADCFMQFRALSESAEAKRRLEGLTAEELAKKRRNYPGTFSAVAAKLRLKNMSGQGIFVAPNEFDGNGRKKENLVAVHAIVLDLD